VFSEETRTVFDQYVVSTRIRAARNVSGFALPAGTLADDRAGVEKVLNEAFEKFDGELKGTYYPLGGLTEEQTNFLLENGFLFQRPKPTNLLWHAGAARSWPDNRGIFHNEARTALCWVNEEDHCRIISMADGGDVKSVFARFCAISDGLKEAAENNGTKLMFSDKLGYLGTCPSNLGTGLRGSVMIKLPKLNEDPEFLELVCDKFNLQPRGSDGEHSAAKDAKWDISNKQRIGFSEVELVQKMIDGVYLIIRVEELLTNGTKTKEEIKALLEDPEQLLGVEEVTLEQTETDVTAGTKSKGCCTIA
jgi:creatine kinase